jgi:HSP20 family protein
VHFSERAYGTFQRSLRPPFPVSQNQVQASFENGVLSVTLPKAQPQERSHRIQVQGAQQQNTSQQGSIGQGGQEQAEQGGEHSPPGQAPAQQNGAGSAPAAPG